MAKSDQDLSYKVIREEIPYDQFLRIKEVRLQFQRFDKSWTPEIQRIILEKKPAVAAVLFLRDIEKFVLVKQFRYPGTYESSPWLEELIAGHIDAGESPEEAMRRELMEESGYKINTLTSWGKFFVSPGYSSEVIHLFFAESRQGEKPGKGGGEDAEEDLALVYYTLQEIQEKLTNQDFLDAKTLIGLQHYLLEKL